MLYVVDYSTWRVEVAGPEDQGVDLTTACYRLEGFLNAETCAARVRIDAMRRAWDDATIIRRRGSL